MFLNRITDNKNLPSNFRKSMSKLVGKTLIIAMLLTGFSMEAAFAEEVGSDIQTIYHVYWEDEYIGGLPDKTELDKLKSLKLDEASKEFKDLSLTITTDLSIVPERVFKIGIDDSVVIGKTSKAIIRRSESGRD